jgi:hypothetical protein
VADLDAHRAARAPDAAPPVLTYVKFR